MRMEERKEIIRLLWYPCVMLALMFLPLVSRVYGAVNKEDSVSVASFILWILNSFLTSVQGAVVAVVFTLDPATRKRLTCSAIKGACINFCKRRSKVREYPAILDVSSDSRNSSMVRNSSDEDAIDERRSLMSDEDCNLHTQYQQFTDD